MPELRLEDSRMRRPRLIAAFTAAFALTAVVLLWMQPTPLELGGEDGSRFRFEAFEERFSCGKADINRAREAFLKRFPINSPIQRVQNYVHAMGGKCFMRNVDLGDDLVCTYAHVVVPLFMATGWVVRISPGDDKKTIGAVKITVGCDSA
jgi:hypothetical protein